MSGLDASILLGAQGVQLPDPAKQYGAAITLGDLARRSRMGAIDEEVAARGLASQKSYEAELPDLVRTGFSADSIVNAVTRSPNAAQLVLKESDARKKAALDQQKTGAETGKLGAETRKMDLAMVGGMAQAILSNPKAGGRDLQALAGLMQRVNIDHRAFGDPTQDPEGWLRNVASSSIEASKQLELQGQAETRAETHDNNLRVDSRTRDANAETALYHRGELGERAATRQQGMEIAKMVDSRSREQNATAREANSDNRINAGTQALAKFVDSNSLPNLMTSATAFDKMVRDNSEGSIAGVGRATGNLPAWMLSDEGKAHRATIQAVSNDLLRLYSGGAVTANEAERRATEMMASGSYTADDLRTAWPLVRGRINAAVQNARAGFSPEVVDTYERRGGMKLQPIGSAGGASGSFDGGGALKPNADGSLDYVAPGKR